MLTSSNLIMYLRKSRSDDPSMSVNEVLAKHERILQEYAEKNFGATIPENRIYREVVSGETIADRPVMLQVMHLIEAGSNQGVLVVEPQRLSRGDLEDCGRIINAFRYTNTLVVTPPKTYNLLDEYDRKFFEMELMRGNDYLEYTKKILNRGRIASAKQGNWIANHAPYGYRRVKKGSGKDAYHTLEIVPEEADNVRLMYHLYLDKGYGFHRIACELDRLHITPRHTDYWSDATLKNILENPAYIGKVRWNYRKTQKIMVDGEITRTRPLNHSDDVVYVDGKHDAIIDDKTFSAVMERRGKNPCLRKNKELSNPFAGLLFCGTCGHGMSYKKFTQARRNAPYVCVSMICNKQSLCHTKSVKYDEFVDRVISSMRDTIADFEIELKNDDGSESALQASIISNLENEVERLKLRDARQKDAYEDGTYTKTEYAERNAKLQEQLSATISALNEAKTQRLKSEDIQDKISKFSDALNALKDPDISATQKNLLLKSCIEKIVYFNEMPSKPGIGRYVDNIFRLEIYYKL